jgi:hypothetical protein
MTKLLSVVTLVAAVFVPALGQTYDHVVITCDSFASLYAPLSGFVENTLGLSDTVVFVEDIVASHQGRDDPERIRNFIRQAYSTWGTSYVLLGGDVEIVPCRRAWVDAYHLHPLLRDSIPADLYFADLDGDWDFDQDNLFGEPEDSCDLYPDLFVSRVPASDSAALALYIDKFMNYVEYPDAEYLDEVLLTGFDVFEGIYGETTMELYDSLYILSEYKPCNKEYDSDPGLHMLDVIRELNQGQHIWVHIDHCNWYGMGMGYMNHGEVMYNNQLRALTNGGKYTIMTSLGCCTGEFDTSMCASECFILAPNGGGLATATNSRYGLGSDGNPQRGMSYVLVEGFVRGLFKDPDENSLEAIADAWTAAAPLADTNLAYRWCIFCWNLLGEAAMPVWVPAGTGTAEERTRYKRQTTSQTVVRGVLRFGQSGDCPSEGGPVPALLVDAAGRRVMDLRPGENRVSDLSPGVYFVVTPSPQSSPTGGEEAVVSKVIIQR